MRSVMSEDQFTPFGLWIRQYLKKSNEGLSITNLDYVLEDFKQKKIMLLEEKQNSGHLGIAQGKTFYVVDLCLRKIATNLNYDYWGFYLLQFGYGKTMPGPGMKLNEKLITVEELVDHLNFHKKICEGINLKA